MNRARGRELRGAGLALLLAAAGTTSARAAGVVGNGTPGSCTEGALNAALAGGGTITFNCGPSQVVIPVTTQKVIAAATTLDGGSADLVILDGGGTSRHLTTNQGVALTVRNLTLRNGRCPNPDPGQPSPGYGGSIRSGILSPLTVADSRFLNNVCDVPGTDGGGAIRQRRGALVIQRTLFQGNRAQNAGAVSSSDNTVLIEDSSFIGNSTNASIGGFTGVGGGFYNDEAGDGQVVLRRTSFINNTATAAAGAVQSFFVPGDQGLVIEDCTFQGNSSPGASGGVLAQLGPLTVRGSTFSGNSGADGAGLYINTSSSATITNSTFSGNAATNVGGGVYAGNSNVTYTHVTIAGNQAANGGGGIAWNGGSAALRGSVVASNTGAGSQCSPTPANGGFNVQFPGPASCAAGALVADPLLGPLASNGGLTQTRAIGAGSPARDLVTSGCPPPATDQRGISRPAGACDAGAFELSGTIAIAGASMNEGTGSNPTLNMSVTLSPASTSPVTVGFATSNGTAVAGADYVAASGTVTFPAGATTRTIGITLQGDALDENDETFTVALSNPVGAVLGNATATGTILDDDAPPQVSIGDCTATEGAACPFPVILSAPSGRQISVNYGTAGGSATSGTDFAPASGTLFFAPLATSASVGVQTVGDSTDEVDESFVVNLTAPTNVTVGDGQGTGTIDDNDGPRVSAGDASVTEGNAGTTPVTFAVTLSAASPQEVRVDYQTSDGTATAGSDYVAASGTLTFAPGQTSRSVGVNVNGDGLDEPDERFYLNLANPVDGSLGNPDGQATIVDNDGQVLRLRELGHGARVRDSFAGGADLYLVSVPAFSSWEIVLDEASGDASSGGPALQRVANDLSTVVQDSVAAGVAGARSLAWRNGTAQAQAAYVRVASTQCSSCGADDTYRLRAYETTLRGPRFNNSSSQITVIVLQNPSARTITGTYYLWFASGSGVGVSAQAFTLAPRASLAFNTASQPPGGQGRSGAVTVVHDGRYGELTGKTVALEGATGFSFDAPIGPRPR